MKEDVSHEACRLGVSEGPANLTLFPDDLLAGTRESDWASGERHHWWLVYTKSRQEKALAQQLLARDVSFYLPLIKRTSLSRGRTRTADVPLFPGYLFLYGTAAERTIVLETNRVSSTVCVADEERLEADLSQIADLIRKDAPLTPEARLVAGQHVRVKSGPFVGHEGVVFRRRDKTRLMVAVDFMQQGVSIAIEDYLLEPYESVNTAPVATLSVNWALERQV